MGVGDDDANAATTTALAEGAPLRAIAMASGGRVSLRMVDAIIRVLNVGVRPDRESRN